MFLIFTGLQARVIMRYGEVVNKTCKSEVFPQKKAEVATTVMHCHLQCYTQRFQVFALPAIVFLCALVLLCLAIELFYFPYEEHTIISGSCRWFSLRGPPIKH